MNKGAITRKPIEAWEPEPLVPKIVTVEQRHPFIVENVRTTAPLARFSNFKCAANHADWLLEHEGILARVRP